MEVRPAGPADDDAIWRILEPVIRAGETYALPRDMARPAALAYWSAPGHSVFVAVEGAEVLGTYFLRANQQGGGAHVANCGYVTAEAAAGRGVAGTLCTHSIELARSRGFRAMQFNFVVSTNDRAVALWQRFGFAIVGRLPQAFDHPRLGLVDAFVLHRML
ncbi:MAG TPA: GNAT family N-acetyltransferase [Aliidongia sp.]|uniref:GNAT family N-acetyltransferase n=1 Tax=Aliidongia sp. TaxID=1914230 RepID=UPI002DDCD5FA|nr:GNAT family N-acetyltransferase [Aliidongia sp.]HEV2674918.1 GNAT family N-acetyltransferase [Aliidongia sp.]